MTKDIFDIDNIDSVIRQVLKEKTAIDLREHDIPLYEILPHYKIQEINIPDKKHYDDTIRKSIKKILKVADKSGFNRDKLGTSVYEAVRNAYQHGNNYDSNKKIVIAHYITRESLDISIIDEGGILKPEFVAFALRFKNPELAKKFMSFYEFTKQEQPAENFGLGTYLIHSYVDEVNYFKSANNGLVVNLHKTKGYDPKLLDNSKSNK